MLILTRKLTHVQRQSTLKGDRLKDVLGHRRGQLADHRSRKVKVDRRIGSAAQVERDLDQRLVQRNRAIRETSDPRTLAERLIQRPTDRDRDILARVVRVHVEIAARLNAEIKAAVTRELVQHVIEHPHPGRHLGLARTVELQLDPDRGLARVASDNCAAHAFTLSHTARAVQCPSSLPAAWPVYSVDQSDRTQEARRR